MGPIQRAITSLLLISIIVLSLFARPQYAGAQNPGAAEYYFPQWDAQFKKVWIENTKAIAEALQFYNNMVTIANETLSIARKTRDYIEKIKNWQELLRRQKQQFENFLKHAYQKNSDWLKTRFGYAPSQLSIINDIEAFVAEGESIKNRFNRLFCKRDDMLYCTHNEVAPDMSEKAKRILTREAAYTKATTSIKQSEMYSSQQHLDQKQKQDAILDSDQDAEVKRKAIKEMNERDSLEIQKHLLKQQIETNKLLVAIYYKLSGGNDRTPYGMDPLSPTEIKDVLNRAGGAEADYFVKPIPRD